MSYWESDPLVFAFNAQGVLVHVDEVPNGLACACVCPSCKQPLVAKNGGVQLVHHFAHQKGACKWAAETAVIMLVQGILENGKTMSVKGAGYWDHCKHREFFFSPFGWLSILAVSQLDVDGRQAPALRVSCLDEGGIACEFALVAALANAVSNEQVEQLSRLCGNVLALDFKRAYANMRDAAGRHFSRNEFFLQAQDPNFLQSILMEEEGSKLLRWYAHPQRDKASEEAHQRFVRQLEEEMEAIFRRRFDEQEEARDKRRSDEDIRAEQEREQAEARRRNIETERRALEAKGIDALLKVQHPNGIFVDDCPLLGYASIATDCGTDPQSPQRCIFFAGQRYYHIACTARQNGIGD